MSPSSFHALTEPVSSPGDRSDEALLRPETDPFVLDGLLRDAALNHGWGTGLIRPRSEGELSRLFRHSRLFSIPLTPVAERTSLTGAAVAEGGWVVDLSLLGPGIEGVVVHKERRTASCPARVLLGDFQRRVEEEGLFHPPDPTSRNEATVGATVACNASGARTFKYGPTRNWVRRVRVVLPDGLVCDVTRGQCQVSPGENFLLVTPSGKEIRVPSPLPLLAGVKSSLGYQSQSSGPDLVDLFVGSEGTLGVLVEVEMELLPLPAATLAGLAFFPSEDKGLDFVERARAPASPVDLRCIEWFDAPSLRRAASRFDRLRIPKEAQVAVFIEQECEEGGEGEVAEAWWELLQATGCCDSEDGVQVASEARGREDFRAFRHAVPAAINEEMARKGRRKLGTDLAWPREKLREMMELYRCVLDDLPGHLPKEDGRTLLERYGAIPPRLERAVFGHIGDNHLHVNLLPDSDAEEDAARRVYRHLALCAVAAGGSVAGEHGIGKRKRDLLAAMVGKEGLERMAAIKEALDPGYLLARGNLLLPPLSVE